jgi:prepilin-type N-terminal cleavage/methylation domain-containing protein
MYLHYTNVSKQKGFTLIELLVVIAIISVLSAIVLVSLNSTRGKGGDAAVKANLATLATQASVYFLENQEYTSAGGSGYGCETAEIGSETFLGDITINGAIKAAAKAAGTDSDDNNGLCWITQTGYYVAYYLPSHPATPDAPVLWCVDGQGQRCETHTFAKGSDPYTPTCQCIP